MLAPRSKRLEWVLSMGVIFLILGVACLGVVLFSACSFNKYIIAAGMPNPDSGFQTGTAFGYDVFVWECFQGRRVVLYRESAEMRAGPFIRQETACGALAPIEEKLANERKRRLDPDRFW